MSEHEQLVRRITAYVKLLDVTTDQMARDAINHLLQHLIERMEKVDAETHRSETGH